MTMPFSLDCAPPFLTVRFPARQRTLGWTLLQPGFAEVDTVVWVEVRNADLGPEVDPGAFLKRRLAERHLGDALAFMTSRDIRRHHLDRAEVEDVVATCLTTVGLANGERVGVRRPAPARVGTINTLVHLSSPLTEGAFIEALSIVAQARTVAVLETRPAAGGPAISGTGTDCIVVAAPSGGVMRGAAGLHTAVGEAIGAAVYRATKAGAVEWNREHLSISA